MDTRIEEMRALRLPELQAKYEEIVGEPTRCPNKTFLLRKIREALDAQAQDAQAAATSGSSAQRSGGLTKMTVEELQHLYEQEVGRPTGSTDKPYLVWKIRQARNGKIRVGPVRQPAGPGEQQVLPFTLPRDVVADLDAARSRLGFKSRQALLREAVRKLLTDGGEGELATRLEGA